MRKQIITPLLVVLLAACAPADYPRAASADGRWSFAVGFPVYESLDTCDDDPSVESAIMSADMPTSHLADVCMQDHPLRPMPCESQNAWIMR